jgi:hypothetical protein
VRRLAKQRREDDYASRRDYQKIHEFKSLRITATQKPLREIKLKQSLEPNGSGIGCFGGYIRMSVPGETSIGVTVDDKRLLTESFTVGHEWSRIGLAFQLETAAQCVVELHMTSETDHVDVWGLDAGSFTHPAFRHAVDPTIPDLNFSHLLPETLYLPHASALTLEIDKEVTSPFALGEGNSIHLKKCSYCGRMLPIDPDRPGRLAFHKHNAKLSGHQNECRACKKWRINNSFNPLRTVDQLNESSLITRERRLLLREPEILRSIKERKGRGLKSIIWEKFDKKCFQCGKALELREVELDHTRPLAYLWPIDEHATCLCAEHNNFKKDKFPVDFYSMPKLRDLAAITGLSVAELSTRSVCEPELNRILKDLVGFAGSWDPRVFNAIARKIREIHPEVDLFERLARANILLYNKIVEELASRPAPVADEHDILS